MGMYGVCVILMYNFLCSNFYLEWYFVFKSYFGLILEVFDIVRL